MVDNLHYSCSDPSKCEAQAVISDLQAQLAEAQAEVERLRAERDDLHGRSTSEKVYIVLHQRAERAEAENQRLRAILREPLGDKSDG